jgi:hypothetical protein
MTRRFIVSLSVALGIMVGAGWGLRAEDQAKSRDIVMGKGRIKLTAPKAWEPKEPKTRIVEFEFATPPAEGDEEPGRVTVMGAGGGVEANIERWKGQFVQPDGGATDEQTRIDKAEVKGAEVYTVSITGTYKDRPGGGPFTQTPVVMRENYRMLSAIIVSENAGHYFIKLYGPKDTVDAQEAAFRKMLEEIQVKSE